MKTALPRQKIVNRLPLIALLGLALTALVLIAPHHPLPAQQTNQPVPRGHFQPEFRDVEIRDFLKTMAQITRRNILIDDSVRGKITIVSYRPIPISEAFQFMKQVLEVRGFAVIEEDNLLKVMPQEQVGGSTMPSEGDPERAGIISHVLTLPPSANLNELAGVLRGAVDKSTNIATYRPTNTLIITGYANSVRRALALLGKLVPESGGVDGTPDVSGENIHIYRVRNLPAESLADVLTRLDNPAAAAGEEGRAAAAQGKIKAVAHKESNSLIVTADAAEWSEVRRIIERLDQARQQLLLEVLVAEVSSNNLNDFGIDWRYQGTGGPHTQFNTGLAAEGSLIDPSSGRISGNNTLSGFSLGFIESGGELMAILNANVNNQNFNVLSAPQVLTLDNQEAEIHVGQDVPVRTQERTSGGGAAESTVNSYEYRPSGIRLKFTPHVNIERRVSLELFSEVTNIEGGQVSGSNPIFNKRNIRTHVTVDDKQTIVIGGLISNENLEQVRKIPLLGDIPLLGHLFRRTTITTKRTNLMVFITPHILDRREDADRITTYKRYEQLKNERERTNELRLWPQRQLPTDPRIELEFPGEGRRE